MSFWMASGISPLCFCEWCSLSGPVVSISFLIFNMTFSAKLGELLLVDVVPGETLCGREVAWPPLLVEASMESKTAATEGDSSLFPLFLLSGEDFLSTLKAEPGKFRREDDLSVGAGSAVISSFCRAVRAAEKESSEPSLLLLASICCG